MLRVRGATACSELWGIYFRYRSIVARFNMKTINFPGGGSGDPKNTKKQFAYARILVSSFGEHPRRTLLRRHVADLHLCQDDLDSPSTKSS